MLERSEVICVRSLKFSLDSYYRARRRISEREYSSQWSITTILDQECNINMRTNSKTRKPGKNTPCWLCRKW